ncbi:MAG TPA: hypothetical protein VFS66_13545 [Acidimicrobiia bacterium]|nr:hypothetical protein [Acidimicrobiia bacterium]
MSPRNDQLAVLRRLKSEGRISEAEYDRLAGDIATPRVEATTVETEPVAERGFDAHSPTGDPSHPQGEDLSETSEDDFTLVPPLPPRLRADLNLNTIGVILLVGLTMIVLATVGAVSWWVSFPAILVLITTLFDGWRIVTVGGSLVVAALLIVGLAASAGDSPTPEPEVTATVSPPNPFPPIPGSLGIYMDQLPDLWNEVSGTPQITRGLTRHDEIGEYDTFIYRFGEWGRVAGAYAPGNDAIFALLVTGQLDGEGTEQLYLHTCHLVAAYSPDCIHSYQEAGLAGLALADYLGQTREAEWMVGESTWRLEIVGNVLTIRVYGPDAA